jgi:hypothetical protein
MVGSVVAVTVAKLLIGRWLAADVDALFFAAVGLVAWRIGARAGILTVFLSRAAHEADDS